MVIKFKFSLLAFLLLFTLQAGANDIALVVYFVKGKIYKGNHLKPLAKGDVLSAKEVLQFQANADAIFVCSNYKAIKVKASGKKKVQSILAQCSADAGSYTGNYFKYVWSQFAHKHGKPETNPKEYMNNVGAVNRGCNGVQINQAIDTLQYGMDSLSTAWQSAWNNTQLSVYDMPMDGAPLIRVDLAAGKPIQWNHVLKDLPPGEYYWQLNDKEGNACERKYLKLWPANEYRQQVDSLIHTVPNFSDAESAFARGFVMEENHFLGMALLYYAEAAKRAPKNKVYQQTVQRFYENKF